MEIIQLKNSRIQCPSCLHYVFQRINCACGKHIRPDQEMIRRIKAVFEILRAPHFRASVLNSRGFKNGPDLWQEHHHKANDALHGCSKKKRQYTSIWDRWQNDKTNRESHFAIGWSDASVRHLDHIAQIDISHKATQEQSSRYHNLLYLISVDEDRQAPPFSTRPGYQEAHQCKGNRDKIWESHLSQKSERQHLGNQLDPSLQGYLAKYKLGRVLRKRPRTTNLISIFSVVFNILLGPTLVVFALARMGSTQLAG